MRKKQRTDTQTPKKAIFIKELAKGGNVTAAARAAGIARCYAYELYNADKNFAAAWDDACKESADVLEAEARRRAVGGVDKPIFQGGVQVGTIREYSDTLLIFLLKGNNPEKFRERSTSEITGPKGSPLVVRFADDS